MPRPVAERAKPPTLREVAQRAGTSIATVSYVISNKDRYVRPELRENVLLAIRELGFVKNAAASSLKGARRGLIAVLVPQFGNNFFGRICVEVEAIVQRAGYVVAICNSDEDPEKEFSILERLVAQRIDGCILSPALSRRDNVALLEQHRVPYVILERNLGDAIPAEDFVGHDNFQSGHLAARTLLDAGHRRIAFAGWDSPIPNINDRAMGYRSALEQHGVDVRREWILLEELAQQAGRRMADRVAQLGVTGLVIGQGHDLAKGVLVGLRGHGLRWPDDISIVLIGTPEWHDLLHPTLTCVERPEAEMGRQAALLLLQKVEAPEYRQPKIMLPTRVLHGASVLGISNYPEARLTKN